MTEELPDDYSPYSKSLIARAFQAFSDFTEVVGGSGAWKLKPLHQQLLDALLSRLEPDLRVLLEQQLEQPFFMQFLHGGRISSFYFKHFRLPREIRLPFPDFDDRLYKVEMLVDGRKQQAHVVFASGRIYMLELKKPLKFYKGKEVKFGATTLGKSRNSYTGALDRLEHGGDGQ